VAKKDDKFDFEKALKELEKLVEDMEGGELSLEDSMKQFERGVALTRSCQQALSDAEQKVKILLDNAGTDELVPFNDNNE
jgi:exodeoxyribonuclease VII small subunit